MVIVLVTAVAVSIGAGPGTFSQAQDFYRRIQILGQTFELIQMYYVEEVDADELFSSAINGVLEDLDPHSHYYSADEYKTLTERYRGDYFGIGIQFDIFNGVLTVLDALEGGPSQALGLRPGDQIVGINGENAVGLDVDQVYEKLRGPKGTDINVTVARPALDNERFEYTITRDKVDVSPILTATMLEGDVGYVALSTFSQRGALELERHLREFEERGMHGFILDLRGNRGGLMNQAVRITDKFIGGDKKIVYTQGRTPNSNGENFSTDRETHPRFPMVVLVDHNSASASEIVAGALQDWDRALIVGQLTWGKALVQNQFPFQDGSALFLTIARYYTPSGRLIQRPYSSGDDMEYLQPDWDALEAEVAMTGEAAPAEALDAIERPVFYTAAGRPVQGGGGIVPDTTVEPTKVSRLSLLLNFPRTGFQFATRYVAGNAASLPTSLESYIEDFEITDEILDEYIDFVLSPSVQESFEAAPIKIDRESLDAVRDDLRMYLRADIAANVWGQGAGRIVLLGYQNVLEEALRQMPQAAALLDMKPQLAGGGANSAH